MVWLRQKLRLSIRRIGQIKLGHYLGRRSIAKGSRVSEAPLNSAPSWPSQKGAKTWVTNQTLPLYDPWRQAKRSLTEVRKIP